MKQVGLNVVAVPVADLLFLLVKAAIQGSYRRAVRAVTAEGGRSCE